MNEILETIIPEIDGEKVTKIVVPYHLNTGVLPEDILHRIYRDMTAEDLLCEFVHERHMGEEEFVKFLNDEAVPSVFVDTEENRYCGFAWLHEIADNDTHRRAFGAYCFFRKYWNRKDSLLFAKVCLAQWFSPESFGIPMRPVDSLWGMTPRPNRLARLFASKLGFRYVASLPGITCYHGVRTDGLVCHLEREEFLGQA